MQRTLILLVVSVALLSGCSHRTVMRWTMIDVCGVKGQADCHLLQLPNGMNVLIDIADGIDRPGAAIAALQQRGIRHVDLVVLSHFHRDHYGRLLDLIRSGVTVDRVAISLPASRVVADKERPWGCNWEDVQATLAFLRQHHIPILKPKTGDRLLDLSIGGVPLELEVVCVYDGVNTPVGVTLVNDTSLVLRLTYGATRVLFTGDLDAKIGKYVVTQPFDLRADILKLPHHGTEGSPPDAFFARVNPRAVLVPAPGYLWVSDRSKRIHAYFTDRKIPAYVSGIDGDVTVTIDPLGFQITSSRPHKGPAFVGM